MKIDTEISLPELKIIKVVFSLEKDISGAERIKVKFEQDISNTEIVQSPESTLKNKVFSIGRIIKKPLILSSLRALAITADFIEAYLFAKRGVPTLGASALISATARFTVSPIVALTEQNTVLIAYEYGRLQKKSTNTTVNDLTSKKEIRENIGIILKQEWLMTILASTPSMILLLNIKPILQLLGQTSEISEIVRSYYLPTAFAMPLLMLEGTNERFLTAIDQEAWLIFFKTINLTVGIGLNLVLIPALGVKGAGLAVLIKSAISLFGMNLFFVLKEDFVDYKLFFLSLGDDFSYMRRMLKQGWPLILGQFALTGSNLIVTSLIGQLGVLRLTIEKVALLYLGLPFSILGGIAEATNRSSAQALGLKDYKRMRGYGIASLVSSGLLFTGAGIAIIASSSKLASSFLSSDTVENSEQLIRTTFILVALNRLLTLLQDACSVNLSAMQDTLLSSFIMILTTIAITLPLSALSFYLTNFDIYGIIGAMDIGLIVAVGSTFTYWGWQANRAVNTEKFDVKVDTSNARLSNILALCDYKKSPRNETEQELIEIIEEVNLDSDSENVLPQVLTYPENSNAKLSNTFGLFTRKNSQKKSFAQELIDVQIQPLIQDDAYSTPKNNN